MYNLILMLGFEITPVGLRFYIHIWWSILSEHPVSFCDFFPSANEQMIYMRIVQKTTRKLATKQPVEKNSQTEEMM